MSNNDLIAVFVFKHTQAARDHRIMYRHNIAYRCVPCVIGITPPGAADKISRTVGGGIPQGT